MEELRSRLESEKKLRHEAEKELQLQVLFVDQLKWMKMVFLLVLYNDDFFLCILQISMKSEMEVAMKLLEKDIHEKQDTIVSLRRQLDDIKQINLEMYRKLQVMFLFQIFYRILVIQSNLTLQFERSIFSAGTNVDFSAFVNLFGWIAALLLMEGVFVTYRNVSMSWHRKARWSVDFTQKLIRSANFWIISKSIIVWRKKDRMVAVQRHPVASQKQSWHLDIVLIQMSLLRLRSVLGPKVATLNLNHWKKNQTRTKIHRSNIKVQFLKSSWSSFCTRNEFPWVRNLSRDLVPFYTDLCC